jgi:hypothetical protein
MQALPEISTHAAQMQIRAPMLSVWGFPPLRWTPCPSGTFSVLLLGGNHTANYRDCKKWKEAKAAIAKRAPVLSSKNTPTRKPAGPIATQAGPSAELMALSE